MTILHIASECRQTSPWYMKYEIFDYEDKLIAAMAISHDGDIVLYSLLQKHIPYDMARPIKVMYILLQGVK